MYNYKFPSRSPSPSKYHISRQTQKAVDFSNGNSAREKAIYQSGFYPVHKSRLPVLNTFSDVRAGGMWATVQPFPLSRLSFYIYTDIFCRSQNAVSTPKTCGKFGWGYAW